MSLNDKTPANACKLHSTANQECPQKIKAIGNINK